MSLNDIRLPVSIFVNADAEVAVRNTLLFFEVSVGTAVAIRPFAYPIPDVTNFYAARHFHHLPSFCITGVTAITDLIIGFPWFLPYSRWYFFRTIFMSLNERLSFSIFVNADAEVPARNTLLFFEVSVETAVAVRPFAFPSPDVMNFFAARHFHHLHSFYITGVTAITDL